MNTKPMPQKRKNLSPLEIIFVFSEHDLAANQQGELSKWQETRIANYGAWYQMALEILLFVGTGISISGVVIAAKVYPLLIVSLAIIAFGIGNALYVRRKRPDYQADTQAREIKMLHGPITLSESWRFVPLYHLAIGEHSLPIAKWQYRELKRYLASTNEQTIALQVYYLPHSQHILSVERISTEN